jgi:hypothetical protein
MGSRVMAQYISEPVRLMNSSIPTDRRTSQKKPAVWEQQQERTPDYFVTYYLIRQGTRNTIIGYRLEASSMAKV